MLITTMNDVPGHEITEVYGEVFGLTVRSRNIGSQIGAGLKSFIGGELEGAGRVGLLPILIHKAGEDPVWREVRTWDGLRVTSIPEVLEVLERC